MKPFHIKPGVGVGSVLFGLSRDEIRINLGKPELIEKIDYNDGTISETWHYPVEDLTLSFDSDDEYRLTMVIVGAKDAMLGGKRIIGLSESKLSQRIEDLGYGKVVLDDDFEENGRDYICDEDSISFWVSEGHVVSVTVLPWFDETGEIPLWPQKGSI